MAAAVVFVAMLLAALSLWTAIPLSWIYIGSKVSHTQFPSSGPYFVVAVGIIVSVLIVAWLIGRLNRLYIQITGTNRLAPMRPTWLRSMRDTSSEPGDDNRGRGGPDGLGDPRRARPDDLVLPARGIADPQSVAQTTNLPSSCITVPSTSILPPRRRSQTRSVWTADSLTPPDSG